MIMNSRITILLSFIFLLGCDFDKDPVHNLIKEQYRDKTFVNDKGILCFEYEPISFTPMMSFSPKDGYYFNIEPTNYIIHKYKCTMKGFSIETGFTNDRNIKNIEFSDTIYLHKKKDSTYEICKKFKLNQR